MIKQSALVGLLHAHLGRYHLTHDDEAKTAFNSDHERIPAEAQAELPPTLRATLK